ncbi:LLM class flavin-dependent oxidoreductase [Streptomyces cinerochromogenes]|uniref:LLM class flavin-dependent oxidoreductase n=1 Tax=Streptomyces cinerochromogenes TaxID=66422 RepID=UPI0033A9CA82
MTDRAHVRDEEGTPTMAYGLSVLDLVAVGEGHTPREALHTSARLARLAEARGFRRYWVAEHHSMPGIASSSPAVILAYLAAQTDRIRLGSGGVMLPNHAPLVVAEQFHTLEAMAPGRVDLGLGRAPGTDQVTARALRRTDGPATGDSFPADVAELMAFLDDDFPEGHPYRRVHAVPGPVQGESVGRPAVWLLGSSGFSAQLAGLLGLPFAFAHHFAARNTIPALELYRQSFRPSPVLAEPYTVVGVFTFAAETEEKARDQARTGALTTVRFRSGRPGLVPTPEEARSHVFTAYEQEILAGWLENAVHGTPDSVRDQLDALAKRTNADELMLASNAHGLEERLMSLSLIADSYGLPHAGPGPA